MLRLKPNNFTELYECQSRNVYSLLKRMEIVEVLHLILLKISAFFNFNTLNSKSPKSKQK